MTVGPSNQNLKNKIYMEIKQIKHKVYHAVG